jgi:hypothetical protein
VTWAALASPPAATSIVSNQVELPGLLSCSRGEVHPLGPRSDAQNEAQEIRPVQLRPSVFRRAQYGEMRYILRNLLRQFAERARLERHFQAPALLRFLLGSCYTESFRPPNVCRCAAAQHPISKPQPAPFLKEEDGRAPSHKLPPKRPLHQSAACTNGELWGSSQTQQAGASCDKLSACTCHLAGPSQSCNGSAGPTSSRARPESTRLAPAGQRRWALMIQPLRRA